MTISPCRLVCLRSALVQEQSSGRLILAAYLQTATARHTKLHFILSSRSPLICLVPLSFGMYICFHSGVLLWPSQTQHVHKRTR